MRCCDRRFRSRKILLEKLPTESARCTRRHNPCGDSPCIFFRKVCKIDIATVARDTNPDFIDCRSSTCSISEKDGAGARLAAVPLLFRDAKDFSNLRMNENETVIACVRDTSAQIRDKSRGLLAFTAINN